jgi:2-polyprenyl-3-methyl-5-hydroxy-6-metoxy-1,4-benzoquinol methylase
VREQAQNDHFFIPKTPYYFMYSILGSKTKERILKYLVENPYKKAKEISKDLGVDYKYTFKILKEFLDKRIVQEEGKKYYLKSEFIAYIKKLSDSLMKNYSKELLFKNKFDLYNTLSSTYSKEKITTKIDNIMNDWIMQKLSDWYSKYYDPEDKEYKTIKKIILSKFGKNAKILEVGCGTGRLTFKLAKDFKKITAVDEQTNHIYYCKKIFKGKNVKFVDSTIKKYKSDEKFNVILLSWIGLHYQESHKEIVDQLEKLMKRGSIMIILDAYYETEYIKILQLMRKRDMKETKLKKEKLNDYLIEKFGNFEQKVLFTEYHFPSVGELINNFKIELTLEESYIWTKEDEEKIKNYLLKKKNPLIIQEGLFITTMQKKFAK